MSHVIAVSGYPGSGKTSLVRGLATALQGAAPIYMDSYERMTRMPIANIAQWLKDGANIDAFDFPGLEDDLVALKRGAPVDDRQTRTRISASKYVIFETQFGRAHQATGRHVDLQVWIDLPFDIALARNLKAFVAGFVRENSPERYPAQMQWLDTYLGNYLDTVRDLLDMQRERVGRKADVVISGRDTLEAMIEAAGSEILRKLP